MADKITSAVNLSELTRLANKLAWKNPQLDVLRPDLRGQYSLLAETLQGSILARQKSGKLILPNLQAFENRTIALFTDSGGEHKESAFLTYSTLVCGWDFTAMFCKEMQRIRKSHNLGNKEIAFKDFSMGQLRRALPNYLNALDRVPGFLFTLAVDKSLTSIFGSGGKDTQMYIAQVLDSEGFGVRKPAVSEKLLRIVHIAAFLTGLFARNGQKLFWMSDNDAISETDKMHEKSLSLFQQVLTMYTSEGTKFSLLGGALPFADDDDLFATPDLLSAADIVAGSLSQYLTQLVAVEPNEIAVKDGCDKVLQWLAHDGVGLRKMNVIMRAGKNGIVESTNMEVELLRKPSRATRIPIYQSKG